LADIGGERIQAAEGKSMEAPCASSLPLEAAAASRRLTVDLHLYCFSVVVAGLLGLLALVSLKPCELVKRCCLPPGGLFRSVFTFTRTFVSYLSQYRRAHPQPTSFTMYTPHLQSSQCTNYTCKHSVQGREYGGNTNAMPSDKLLLLLVFVFFNLSAGAEGHPAVRPRRCPRCPRAGRR
jgi:hypothetical protein